MDQLYSPCSLLEEFFEAICRCLGGDHHRHRDPKTTNSSSDAEREQKFMEEKYGMEYSSIRALKAPRKPPRPPIGG
ncbi:hypothetical protein ACOSP7_021978 [Xanthoceras sorbifolium]